MMNNLSVCKKRSKWTFCSNLDNQCIFYEKFMGEFDVLFLFVCQGLVKKDFGDVITEMSCPNKKFSFKRVRNIYFTVHTSDIDVPLHMIRQVRTLFQMMMSFRFNLYPYRDPLSNWGYDLKKTRELVEPLILSVLDHLYNHNSTQSVLFNGLEPLNLIDRHQNRDEIEKILSDCCSPNPHDDDEEDEEVTEEMRLEEESVRKIQHCVLIIKSKVIAVWTKSNSQCGRDRQRYFVLLPEDILSLVIYENSLRFENIEINETETEDEKDEELKEEECEGENVKSKSQHKTSKLEEYERFEPFMFFVNQEITQKIKMTVFLKQYLIDDTFNSKLSIFLICSGSPPRVKDEVKKIYEHKVCARIKTELDYFINFINIKANTKIHISQYFREISPGIVHFVLIDKIKRIVRVPTVSKLGERYDEDFVLRNFYDMIDTISQFRNLKNRPSEIIIKKNGFIYSYVEVFLNYHFQIEEFSKGNMSKAIDHFELFAMYIPFLSFETIKQYNMNLLRYFCEKEV